MSEPTIDQAAYEAAYRKLAADVLAAVNGNLPAFDAAWSGGAFPAAQLIHVTGSAFAQVFTDAVETHMPEGSTFEAMALTSSNALFIALRQIIAGKMALRGIAEFCPASVGATRH